MIEFACPHCGHDVQVQDSAAGRSGKCRKCGQSVKVPALPVAPSNVDVPVAQNATVVSQSRRGDEKIKLVGIWIIISTVLPILFILPVSEDWGARVGIGVLLCGIAVYAYGTILSRRQGPMPGAKSPQAHDGKGMPARAIGYLALAGLLTAFPLIMCTGALFSPRRPVVAPQQWYSGGTLHTKTCLEWQTASPSDKLATCADFIAKMKDDGNLNSTVTRKLSSIDDIRPFAEKLVDFLDEVARPNPNSAEARKWNAAQNVASMAGVGMIQMGWTKRPK